MNSNYEIFAKLTDYTWQTNIHLLKKVSFCAAFTSDLFFAKVNYKLLVILWHFIEKIALESLQLSSVYFLKESR